MSYRGRWIVSWVIPLVLATGRLSAQERWVYRYDGPGGDWDEANAIVMGMDGNLYATGLSHGAGTGADFTTISLTPSGGERWVYRYNGPGNDYDEAHSIVVGTDGNLYAAGMSEGSGTDHDFTIISLTPSGGERWVYRRNGSANSWDMAWSIAAGADSNLYAAGWIAESGTGDDFTVISLASSGGERWVYTYDGPGNRPDKAYSIVVGADANLYVAGHGCGSGLDYDFTVISLGRSGDEGWVYLYDGPGNRDDVAASIVMGEDSNLYAAGMSGPFSSMADLVVVSLTTSGEKRWVYRYDGPGNDSDRAESIVMGTDGNLYVAGMSKGVGTWYDFTVISLTPAGEERWVYRYNGPDNFSDWCYSITAGTDGNLYAAGWSDAADLTVISLTASGNERWVYRYSSGAANSIIAGPDGSLYVAGLTSESGSWPDFTVVSLAPDVGVEEKPGCPERSRGEARLDVLASPIPAVSAVKVQYLLPKATEVKLSIYDGSGRLVKNLVKAREDAGSRTVFWDCRDSKGERVASGTYLVRLHTRNSSTSRKLIVFE